MSDLTVDDCPSPNFGTRAAGPTDILILHYTDMADDDEALAWLCSPASKVSSHYFVHRDGRVLRLVSEEQRAWHAGASIWGGEPDINSRSIGIEVANAGHRGGLPPYPAQQIEALILLCRGILARHPIPPHRVLAHSDVAPGRKQDPGERFPWATLSSGGVGHCVHPAPIVEGPAVGPGDTGPQVLALQQLLALYGYGIETSSVFDQRTAHVVAAFQQHFRPERIDGVGDTSTVETLKRLLDRLP